MQVQFAEGIYPPNINRLTQDDDSSRGGESCYSFSSQLPHGRSISTISTGSIPNSTKTVQVNTTTAKPDELKVDELKIQVDELTNKWRELMEENQKLKEPTTININEEIELVSLEKQHENCIPPSVTPTVDHESDSATVIDRRSESDGASD